MSAYVTVLAESFRDNGDGTITLALSARSLSGQETDTLERLFPNTFGAVRELLQREALLSAITHPPREVDTSSEIEEASREHTRVRREQSRKMKHKPRPDPEGKYRAEVHEASKIPVEDPYHGMTQEEYDKIINEQSDRQ